MLPLERRKKILQWMTEVRELAATFRVSPMTIRRDLKYLEKESHLLGQEAVHCPEIHL